MKRTLTLAAAWLAALTAFAYPQEERHVQWKTLEADIKARGDFKHAYEQAYCRDATILPQDRDPLDIVLRRTAALADDLAGMKANIQKERKALAALTEKAAQTTPGTQERQTLFDQALDLRRTIALSNPLLNFDKILFIKRNVAHVMEHMSDQYYGAQQTPGGGLFVLDAAFSPNPTPRDILSTATVAQGRLAGTNLTYGSILSPALDFNARRIAFAYVECQGKKGGIRHLDHANNGHWERGRSYHLFSMNLDGTSLTQLTDGTYNDHSPCFMPSGRIAFLSERRGAFIRCGRYCPSYTLHDMAPDGSDIRCLSIHDVSEWSPAVNSDGRLLWTRWDYIDRHGCTAHMPWITTPDGRDPRPLHGNYSLRYKRADAEIDTRPIPSSRSYIATAAPHHGQSFGSLIHIDPAIPDNDRMGPVRRFTPEVKFPESERGLQIYAAPWPLSDTYHLCSYAPTYSTLIPRHNFGLYLVDKFGNKELIYRDPAIASLTPIPLKPAPRPRIIPEHRHPKGTEATITVADVYKSLLPWPQGETGQVKALRVWQLYPMPVSSDEMKRNIGIQIPEGSDSVNLARALLGTVPVEPDGSAHFKAPSGIPLFFQALDANGCAIQSMRSAVSFIPGEILSCIGCHESKTETAPPGKTGNLLAMRRPPSKLLPGPAGSRPFSYPILVQPVLDKKCVACHTQNKDKAPRLDSAIIPGDDKSYYGDNTHTFTASYLTLAKKYGFTTYGAGRDFNNPKFYRTTPGQFGARASKLYPMLLKGHHGVTLTPEEMQRIIIWLDSVSQFYGVYEPAGLDAQLRGETVWPTLQ